MDERLLSADSIVFDVGNVLLTFDPAAVVGLLPEACRGRMHDVLFGKDRLWGLFDLGAESNEAAAKKIAMTAGAPEMQSQILYLSRHFPETMLPLPLYGMLETLKGMGKKLYALTNFPEPAFTIACERYPLLKLLNGAVVSAREKLVKPDPAIYQLLIRRFSLSPGACLYIDDDRENAAAGSRAGFKAWHYAGSDRIFQENSSSAEQNRPPIRLNKRDTV